MIEFLFIFVSGQVMFDAVGGLNKQIRALKEMVLFPLMYPEVFEKFKISPPRGVLFHGPPGMTVFFFGFTKCISLSMRQEFKSIWLLFSVAKFYLMHVTFPSLAIGASVLHVS